MIFGAVNRIIMVIASFVVLFEGEMDIIFVAAFLCAVVAGGCGVCINDRRYMYAVILAYLMLLFKFPKFIAGVPLIVYELTELFLNYSCDLRNKKINYMRLLSLLAVLTCLGVCICLKIDSYSGAICRNLAVLSVMALAVCIYSNFYLLTRYRLIETVDNSNELNMVLAAKNRYLIEKQDTEIHIATLSERNRIAREIHDNVGHMLSRSILQIGAVMAVNKDEKLDSLLVSIKDTLDTAMNSIRSSVHNLHDTSVDLENSMQEIVNSISGFKVDYEYDVEGEVSKNLKYCIISITKEAVSNIIKHCNGDYVKIVLREHPAFYQLLIKDNGTDISNAESADGIGLVGMKERVSSFGGTITINTMKGFSIFINIPKNDKGDNL